MGPRPWGLPLEGQVLRVTVYWRTTLTLRCAVDGTHLQLVVDPAPDPYTSGR
ncbi:hypothetical protein [Streptomyces caniferus]|uniref:hypothetical protein n=1 Tax=Streptomyces caniferus TaxID=285557 RepID=UPI003807B3A0